MHNALELPVFFFFLIFSQPYPEYWGIQSKKLFYRPSNSEYMVLEIHFRSLKYTAVIRICKNLSNFPFKRYETIRQLVTAWNYNSSMATMCWCKQPTWNSFQTCLYCIYLLKLYDKLIIILLTNDLTNICSEISQIRLILWKACTSKWKGWSWKVG